MGTKNQFDLLVDVDNDDPSHLIAAAEKKAAASPKPAPAAPAKLPTKPPPPAQAGEFILHTRFHSNRIGSRGFGFRVLNLMRESGDLGLKCTKVVWDCCTYVLIWYSEERSISLAGYLVSLVWNLSSFTPVYSIL